MSEHTPGPWLRDGRCVYALETVCDANGKEYKRNRFYFGVQGSPAGPSEKELEAVARLAQAAPVMLQSLETIAKILGDAPCEIGRESATGKMVAALVFAKSAIDEARMAEASDAAN